MSQNYDEIIDPLDLRPSMRATPSEITAVEGSYAYVAEL